ncbi:MAG: N-succinylarginine dihydrolase [Polyangiales bacterium]|nr:N-succinylarginine dihydrolase [Myxococcales bacterium]
MTVLEANFDGLVGPTHNYAGLAYGNLASTSNRGSVSRPREAVLQGLRKMKALADLGIPQGVLPPLERPDIATLRRLGFGGKDSEVIAEAGAKAPTLLAACSSVSSMWVANAATTVPATDADDGRPHFVPANLVSSFHRSIEAAHTARNLARVFPSPHFIHHAPLPATPALGDEGAANHTRFCGTDGHGVHLFVYGRLGLGSGDAPKRFPARQTREASEAVARLAGLDERNTVFAQQSPAVIDAGVFHNDVIAVGHGRVLLYHEDAFVDSAAVVRALGERVGPEFEPILVERGELAVTDAVTTYLFNSQLVTLPDGTLCLIAPAECESHPKARAVIDRIVGGSASIRRIEFFDLRESMRNGGGPACLRLRVPLRPVDLDEVHRECLLDEERYGELVRWAERHYREELAPDDLRDPKLLIESRTALDALTHILRLPRLYPFQQ